MGQSKRINNLATERRMQEAERLAQEDGVTFTTNRTMENKQAKLTNIESQNSYTTQHGTFYNYQLTFDNGDVGQYGSKKESIKLLPFGDGDTLYYEYHGGQYPKIKKPSKNNPNDNSYSNNSNRSNSTGRTNSYSNNASFALSYAKDLAVAHIAKGNEFGSKEIIKVADALLTW